MQDKQGNPIPYDGLDKKMSVEFLNDDGSRNSVGRDVTDVWVRQDSRWINLVPSTRTYKVNLRIFE